jgi:hypothetical protein
MRETRHSPPSSAEVKEWVELHLHSPLRLHGVVLSYKHRDNFTYFTLLEQEVPRSSGNKPYVAIVEEMHIRVSLHSVSYENQYFCFPFIIISLSVKGVDS